MEVAKDSAAVAWKNTAEWDDLTAKPIVSADSEDPTDPIWLMEAVMNVTLNELVIVVIDFLISDANIYSMFENCQFGAFSFEFFGFYNNILCVLNDTFAVMLSGQTW